jgi:hypothetical protein
VIHQDNAYRVRLLDVTSLSSRSSYPEHVRRGWGTVYRLRTELWNDPSSDTGGRRIAVTNPCAACSSARSALSDALTNQAQIQDQHVRCSERSLFLSRVYSDQG